ncbi:MAG: PEGA domain-containing protein, partial [Gemmatimonadota bacterium]
APWIVTALVRGADGDPTRQFGSVVDLVAALQAPPAPSPGSKQGQPMAVVMPDGEPTPRLARRLERRRVWVTALTMLTIVGAGLGFVRWLGTRDRDERSPLASRDTARLAPPNPAPPAAQHPPGAAPRRAATPPAPAPAPSPVDTITAPAAAPSQVDTTPTPSTPEPVVAAVTPARVDRTTRPASAASARLSVSSVPGGTLYVDNRLIGATPRSRLPLSPGRHVIKITKPGYRRYLSMIELTGGEQRRLTNLVLERER